MASGNCYPEVMELHHPSSIHDPKLGDEPLPMRHVAISHNQGAH
jgi:hypothetical protein